MRAKRGKTRSNLSGTGILGRAGSGGARCAPCILARTILLVYMILGVSACSVQSMTPEVVPSTATNTLPASQPTGPVVSKTPTPTATPAPIPTQTETPKMAATITATLEPFSFAGLSSGQYILYYSIDAHDSPLEPNNLKIVSINGQSIYTIPGFNGPEFGDYAYLKLAPNKKQAAYYSFNQHEILIVDLLTNAVIPGPSLYNCGGWDWSPDGTKLLLTCDSVYIYSIQEGKLDPILWHEPGRGIIPYCDSVWSPDRKWIVTHLCYSDAFNLDQGGELFLTDAGCITNPTTCQTQTRILEKVRSQFYSPTWSPDSRFVAAIYSAGVIGVWNIETSEMRKIILPKWTGMLDYEPWGHLAWSPDGKWLAYSQPDEKETDSTTFWNIYIISPDGGEPRLVVGKPDEKFVLGWLTVP